MSYDNNFCLQKTVKQHPFMSRLCPTSVNTIRFCVYRSVVDETPRVTASIIRVGKNGSYLDNAHAGGKFVGVDVKTGVMGKYAIDQFGVKNSVWNDIDFSKENLIVPYWKDIICFAEYVGSRILHHRLLALDVAIDEDGKPVLIEYNISGFSFWLFMYTGQEVFGLYTDEIIDYCAKRNAK